MRYIEIGAARDYQWRKSGWNSGDAGSDDRIQLDSEARGGCGQGYQSPPKG